MIAKEAKLIIFDCDGVLIDSEYIYCRIDAELFTEAGFPITAAQVSQRFTGVPVKAMMQAIEAEMEAPLPADFYSRLLARAEQEIAQHGMPVIAGMDILVAATRTRKCVASSSGVAQLDHHLGHAGLLAHFAPHIFSAEMVARGKPAPDVFLHAAKHMQTDPGDCLVIEDSVAGVTAAKAAGMAVVGFLAGRHIGPGHGEQLLGAGAMTVFQDAAGLSDFLVHHLN